MWTFWFTFVVVLGSFSLGSTKQNKGKPHETELKHEMKSVVHEAHEASPQTLLKAAPLGFGLGMKSKVPKTNDNGKEDDKNNEEDDGNIKTESETTTTKNGPFRTVTTVTKKLKMGKNNKQKLIGQSITKITTTIPEKLGKYKAGKYNDTGLMNGAFNPFGFADPKKPGKVKDGKPKEIGLAYGLFNPFGFADPKQPGKVEDGKSTNSRLTFDFFKPFGFGLFADDPEPQCSSKKGCKKPGMFCDKMDNQCRKKVKLDGRCDQAGQCDSNEKQRVACLWGRCSLLTKSVGFAGLFCKKDKDCKSEELHCAAQLDISEVSNVCIFKLSEGQTCGRRNVFNFFAFSGETTDQPCKKGLTCEQLGLTGRKICRRAETLNNDENDVDEED